MLNWKEISGYNSKLDYEYQKSIVDLPDLNEKVLFLMKNDTINVVRQNKSNNTFLKQTTTPMPPFVGYLTQPDFGPAKVMMSMSAIGGMEVDIVKDGIKWARFNMPNEERNEKENMEFDLVLHEKSVCDGLVRSEAIDLIDMLGEKEFLPIELEALLHESVAEGFITLEFADECNFDYEESGLRKFIANILDDMDNESEDCVYTFHGHKIWLTR